MGYVVDRISAEDPFFAKVVASQKAYAKDVMNYLNLNQPDYKLAYKHYFVTLSTDLDWARECLQPSCDTED